MIFFVFTLGVMFIIGGFFESSASGWAMICGGIVLNVCTWLLARVQKRRKPNQWLWHGFFWRIGHRRGPDQDEVDLRLLASGCACAVVLHPERAPHRE